MFNMFGILLLVLLVPLAAECSSIRILKLSDGVPFQMGKVDSRRIVHPGMGAKKLTLNYSVSQPGHEFPQHVHDDSSPPPASNGCVSWLTVEALMASKNKTSQARARTLEREERAFQLRKKGASYTLQIVWVPSFPRAYILNIFLTMTEDVMRPNPKQRDYSRSFPSVSHARSNRATVTYFTCVPRSVGVPRS